MSIRVEHLTHIYDKGLPTEQIALEDINFTVADGELLGVIGHTGSGKSTLLQHLNGLLKPNSGRVIVGDVDITAPGVSMVEIRKRIGLVFQYPEYQLFEETVAKDVAFGPKNLGLSEQEIEERIHEILKKMDVEKVWINPDCGLKTRGNAETWPSLEHLVTAAKAVRAKLAR